MIYRYFFVFASFPKCLSLLLFLLGNAQFKRFCQILFQGLVNFNYNLKRSIENGFILKNSVLFNSREAIAAIIGDIVVFLQFKEFELYWVAVFFLKICSHIF